VSEEIHDRDIWGDLAAGEPALTLNEARKLPCFRRDGRQPDVCTLYRFTSGGAKPSGGGERVVLEHFQQAGRRCTTRSAAIRFLRALSGPHAKSPSRAEATKAHQEAERRLRAAGL
jgi:hypothetical protein